MDKLQKEELVFYSRNTRIERKVFPFGILNLSVAL